MKVIFVKDMPKVARKYDVKEVADGYGRNMLIKNGWAVLGTPDALKKIETKKKAALAEKAKAEEILMASLEGLKDIAIKIAGKANEEGSLFAGIKAEDLTVALKQQTGISIPNEYIDLEKPLKEVGEHKVDIEVSGKKVKITVVVEAEK